MHVLPNIKPWLLKNSHPDYDTVVHQGGFVRDGDAPDKPHRGLFWAGGEGARRRYAAHGSLRARHCPCIFWLNFHSSHPHRHHRPSPVASGSFAQGSYLDFSSEAGYNWWRDHCRSALLDYGATALWNDNNEYEVRLSSMSAKIWSPRPSPPKPM